ncbi:MAG: (2Fe-2S) ferredoxin domain-containing protein [Clostridia bacterium]|nr:(2Fe-2S) ferredoxin domain-containing protein [Clostridia bacterium]
MIIQICVGSSCHLKGSEKLVELFQKAIAQRKLEDEITLAGSFCTGQCNRIGVTVTVNDDVFTGITPENFDSFFNDKVIKSLEQERV